MKSEYFDSEWVRVRTVAVYHLWWNPDLRSEIQRCGGNGNLLSFHVCDWAASHRGSTLDRHQYPPDSGLAGGGRIHRVCRGRDLLHALLGNGSEKLPTADLGGVSELCVSPIFPMDCEGIVGTEASSQRSFSGRPEKRASIISVPNRSRGSVR